MAKEERVPKVVVLLGSPRKKGNSAILAAQIAKGAKAAGAKVETIYLQGLNIAPCKSCHACQKEKSRGCAIQAAGRHEGLRSPG
jgi:Multimeric flavodoxin WrbA